jgi:hypothetical protein
MGSLDIPEAKDRIELAKKIIVPLRSRPFLWLLGRPKYNYTSDIALVKSQVFGEWHSEALIIISITKPNVTQSRDIEHARRRLRQLADIQELQLHTNELGCIGHHY